MQNRDVFVLMSVRNQHHSMSSTRYGMNEVTDYQIRTLSNYEQQFQVSFEKPGYKTENDNNTQNKNTTKNRQQKLSKNNI